jgi:tRNA 2-thiouridine synthesizing protein A
MAAPLPAGAKAGLRPFRPAPNEETQVVDRTLDVKGLRCPLPILLAKKALAEVRVGGALEILATDPMSAADFADFCRATGARLRESSADAGVYRFVVERVA